MIPTFKRRRVSKAAGSAADSTPANVVFVQCAPPPIDAGIYQITATQTISASTDNPYSSVQEFSIAGPKVQLPPGAVNSVFPAANSQGEFNTVLPHVVFNNVTLPWVRNMGSAPDPPQPAPTWLGLLLFDASDPPPTPVAGTKQDLITPPAGTFFPGYSLEPGEQATDPIVYIDVPFGLFNAICPSLNDLGWLAHVRQVEAANQPANQHFPPANGGMANYSVVFSNRLPAAGSDCVMVLVSLESYQSYLPDDNGNASNQFTSTPTNIRLASLYSWSFDALPQAAYFEAIVSALSVEPGGVQLPQQKVSTQNPQADAFVAAAFARGYTAVLENLPDGTPSASWYRGPLLPYTSETSYLQPPYPGPDGLRRFDPNTGLSDISYAAAWQLGQLLALRSGTFSSALYRWNLAEMSAAAGQQQQAAFQEKLAGAVPEGAADIPGVVRAVVRPAVEAIRQRVKKGGS
jgi:hypothetical protein